MYSSALNDFQIGVDCLVEANREYWEKNSTEIVQSGKWIYVLHDVHTRLSLCMVENIVAKALQHQERLPAASIISGRADDLMDLIDQVDASFGVEQRFHPSYHSYDSEKIRELAGRMSAETYGKKDELLALEYRNVRFGDVLYDDILRGGACRDRGKVFGCFDISQERYYEYVRDALAAIDQAYEIFEVRKPDYLITTEYFYTKSLYAHVAKALGAKIVITFGDKPDIMVRIDPDGRPLSEVKYSDIRRAMSGKCLQYDEADSRSNKDFFVVENGCEGEIQIPEEWGKKPNVFILPHAMSDAPRQAGRFHFCYDYVDWFVETLKIVQDIPSANWIVKDHPWTSFYGQEEYVRSVFETFKTNNMFWIDSQCSGLNVKELADCVITCTGDAGIEYWAYGIPTITAGDAYYCNWGISYQVKTLTEYKTVLQNINSIAKPSRQSAETAQSYITAIKNWSERFDVYSNLISKLRKNEGIVSQKGAVSYGVLESVDQQLGKITRDFCEAYVKLMKEYDLKETPLFQLEYLCTI